MRILRLVPSGGRIAVAENDWSLTRVSRNLAWSCIVISLLFCLCTGFVRKRAASLRRTVSMSVKEVSSNKSFGGFVKTFSHTRWGSHLGSEHINHIRAFSIRLSNEERWTSTSFARTGICRRIGWLGKIAETDIWLPCWRWVGPITGNRSHNVPRICALNYQCVNGCFQKTSTPPPLPSPYHPPTHPHPYHHHPTTPVSFQWLSLRFIGLISHQWLVQNVIWLHVSCGHSSELKCDMKFAVFLPVEAEKEKVPVLYWLSGNVSVIPVLTLEWWC